MGRQQSSAVVQEVESYLRTLRGNEAAIAEFQTLYQRDYHTCDCPWPHVERAWGGAVGVFREIRLCCMARALERLAGLPEGTFYLTMDFAPLFVWDCEELVEVRAQDGVIRQQRRGVPPAWMRKRLARKGIQIQNLPAEIEERE